jgi:peptidoglycan/LPS O-acetylase OafA/YrhL
MVLGGHLLTGWPNAPGALDRIPRPILSILDHGWLGVDLFFVLSGFLITGILLDSRDHPRYFRNFYARRCLRIFPLYYAVIGVAWLVYGDSSGYLLASAFYLANFAHYFDIAVSARLGVLWSLAVEEHFYLVWPWLVRFSSRKALTTIACGLVVGAPLLRMWGVQHGLSITEEIYKYTWFRLDGLALGALLAVWVRSRFSGGRRSLGLAAGLLGLSLILTVAGIPFGILGSGSMLRYTQWQLVFAAFLLAAVATRGTRWTAPLRWPFVRLSGELSYCIYLINYGVGDGYEALVRAMAWEPAMVLGPFGAVVLRTVFVVVGTFAVALLSRRFFERPLLGLKRHFEYAPAPRPDSGTPRAVTVTARIPEADTVSQPVPV